MLSAARVVVGVAALKLVWTLAGRRGRRAGHNEPSRRTGVRDPSHHVPGERVRRHRRLPPVGLAPRVARLVARRHAARSSPRRSPTPSSADAPSPALNRRSAAPWRWTRCCPTRGGRSSAQFPRTDNDAGRVVATGMIAHGRRRWPRRSSSPTRWPRSGRRRPCWHHCPSSTVAAAPTSPSSSAWRARGCRFCGGRPASPGRPRRSASASSLPDCWWAVDRSCSTCSCRRPVPPTTASSGGPRSSPCGCRRCSCCSRSCRWSRRTRCWSTRSWTCASPCAPRPSTPWPATPC